jgi:hypothetical protein
MPAAPKTSATASCACKGVAFEATGSPIACAVCHCKDCEEGSRQIEALPNAHAVREADGGTAYIVFRKDRFTCTAGAPLLKPYKISQSSATSRVVATCCKSPMFLGFDDTRHWVSAYRGRFQGDVPPLQMRICTKFRTENGDLPKDLPNYSTFSLGFMVKLLGAKIAMVLHL